MGKKKKSAQKTTSVTEPLVIEESAVDDMRKALEEIKEYDGVIGYIVRNSTSATIELGDPTKIIDYAILSSSALETSEALSDSFSLGSVKSIIVEGKDVKMLSLEVKENRISVFTEKKADCKKIMKKLYSL